MGCGIWRARLLRKLARPWNRSNRSSGKFVIEPFRCRRVLAAELAGELPTDDEARRYRPPSDCVDKRRSLRPGSTKATRPIHVLFAALLARGQAPAYYLQHTMDAEAIRTWPVFFEHFLRT
jgi:hypothetical protein